jgi:radical SAM superfamily enzyme YgiQ (UPF0313 family)
MRILLLNLPNPPSVILNRDFAGGFGSAYQGGSSYLHDVFPPLFDTYTASILEKNGIDVKILDFQDEPIQKDEFIKKVAAIRPEVIISRISMPSLENDLSFVSLIKENLADTIYIGWGSICKVLPDEVLGRGTLDLLIRTGEIDTATLEMIDVFLQQKDIENIKDKPNVSFKKEGKIFHNPSDKTKVSLDQLPLPAYHLLDMKKYVAVESHYIPKGSDNIMIPFFTVGGSRGCSFNCLYCPYPVIFGTWKGRSPEKIVDEMECLADNYNIKSLWFYDQTFSMDINRSMKICEEIIDRKLDVNWACETRADKIPKSLLKRMRDAGCMRVQVGIETGDSELLKKIGKPGSNIADFEENIRNIKEMGIMAELNFIVGLPGERWKSIFKTAKFIRKVKPEIFSISIITPFPGTPLYETAEKEGWLITKDLKRYGLSNTVMSLPEFSSRSMRIAERYLYYQALFAKML